jgi:formylmethanofuran dehydrogenase subunit B
MATEPNIMGVAKVKTENSLQNLVDGKFDAALVVSDDSLMMLPGPAAKALAQMPLIYIGPNGSITDAKAKVSIHTTGSMLLGSGKMQRLDNVEVSFKQWQGQPKEYVTESDVITKLHELVSKEKN